MNRLFALVFVFCVCFMPVRVFAQTGERLAQMADCMTACMEQHVMCISTNDMLDCLMRIEECQTLVTDEARIIQSFCEACGSDTNGCSASPDDGAGDGAVMPYTSGEPPGSVGSSEPLSGDPDDGDDEPAGRGRGRGRGRTEGSRERPPTPPPVRTVEDLCRVAGGIWDPDFAIIQSRPPTAATEVDDTESPYEGEEVRGVCWTREGERLARLLRDERASRIEGDSRIEALVEEEAAAREAADHLIEERSLDRDHMLQDADEMTRVSVSTLSARMLCMQTGQEYINLSDLPERMRAQYRRDLVGSGMLEDERIHCPDGNTRLRGRYSASSAGTFGFRFSLMPGLGFQPLTAEQTIETPIPFYLMGELSLTASIGGDWFIDGGLGFGYPFPDYRGRAMLEGIYHLGFLAVIENVVAVGFGGALMERYTDVFQSIHTIAGGYVEADYNLRRGGWQPYIGLRVVLGVGLRAGYDAVLDGAAFLMLGIAHLDADDGNIDTVFDDCTTPHCRDTGIGRVQVP